MYDINSSGRPPIPDPIKREVRQRCGFGCVICGLPLYTYEHMLGYANLKDRAPQDRHIAEELTLLCDLHQRESTNKLLARDQIMRANKKPYNLLKGISSPYLLHYGGPNCAVDIGANVFPFEDKGGGTELIALAIDDDPLISFKLEDGHWLLNLNAFDKNDNLVLRIVDNELVYSIAPWDIEFVGHNLIIREALGKILVDLSFEPPSLIKLQRGHFLHNGIEIEIGQNGLEIVNNHISFENCNTSDHSHGFLFGNKIKPNNWAVWIAVVPRYK